MLGITAQIRLRLSSGLICKYGEIKVLFQMIYKRRYCDTMEKKVFVPYAWTNDAYQKKIVDLATRLREDGINVILDK